MVHEERATISPTNSVSGWLLLRTSNNLTGRKARPLKPETCDRESVVAKSAWRTKRKKKRESKKKKSPEKKRKINKKKNKLVNYPILMPKVEASFSTGN